MKKGSSLKSGAVIAGLALAVGGLALGSAIVLGADKDAAVAAAGEDEAQDAEQVRVTIHTVPARPAVVRWGKKKLGVIPVPRPLVVTRPRDSGPLDLVIYAAGFLPVHTRAYTFSDSRLAVKITPVSEKHTLFGYRQEPPPEGTPDGGAPAPAAPPAPAARPTPPPGPAARPAPAPAPAPRP